MEQALSVRSSVRWTMTVLAMCSVVALGCSEPDEAPYVRDATASDQTYDFCTQCHGADLQGNPEIGAPTIAGLPAWYVEGQLKKFKDGVRGTHYDDINGMKMRPMTLALTEHDIVEIAKVVEKKSPAGAHASLENGDPTRGKTLFAPCTACHGPDAKGNPQLNAPPLHEANDWYLLTQLKNFKHGVRGANPKDTTGGQMRPMAQGLADEQAMRDVIAYIGTL